MTINREQAKQLAFTDEERSTEYSCLVEYIDDTIDAIYDSFESQTCDNCAVSCVECPILNAIADTGAIRLVNFGCNQHKPNG